MLLVVGKWIDICERKFLDPLTTNKLSMIMTEAQKSLPAARHRSDTSFSRSGLEPVLRLVKTEYERRLQQRATVANTASSVATIPAEVEKKPEKVATPGAITPQVAQERVEQPVDNFGIDFSAMPSLEEIARHMGKRVAAVMIREVENGFNQYYASKLPKMQQQAMNLTGRLPKVLVIGPLAKQQPFLEEAVDGMLDLRFVSSEDNPSLISMRGQNCGACLLWSRFVSHKHTDVAKTIFKGAQFQIEKGGVEALKEKLEEMAVQIA